MVHIVHELNFVEQVLLLLVFDEVVLALDLDSHMLVLFIGLDFFFEILDLLVWAYTLRALFLGVLTAFVHLKFAFSDFAKSSLAEWLGVDKVIRCESGDVLNVSLLRLQSLFRVLGLLLS